MVEKLIQLSKLVSFHKTMGDTTRIRIISLLANGPLHGQAIAGKLGLTHPTITHHLTKLKQVDLVVTRREKNTIYYDLNKGVLEHQAQVLLQFIHKQKGEEKKVKTTELEKKKVIENFITKEGKLKHLPAQMKKKLFVLEYLVRGLEKGKKYEEKEINKYIKQYHEDFATIRREFIMNHFMYRENGIYELNPEEMWRTTVE